MDVQTESETTKRPTMRIEDIPMPSVEQTMLMAVNLTVWAVRIARETLAFVGSFIVGSGLSWVAFKLADRIGPLR